NPAAHLAPKRLREFISVDHSDVHLAIQRQASPAYAAPRNVGSDHRLLITDIAETSDQASAYPTTLAQIASYNNLNQLTDVSGQAPSFDANGNLLSDGQRDYTWDAENRLTGITYPGQPGKQTTFAYNGLGQHVAVASTAAGGGSAVTTSYIWCGSGPCRARDASNSPTREYLAEGEFVPGSPGQPYYYGVDQVGSVRRIFASTSDAPAYGYDPYGNALQSTAPLTDFGYAGMFYNADSGLYLTLFRAYDPVAGRWLSRDPVGETSNLGDYIFSIIMLSTN
ncbi:MAG TPA: RHS repeat-associated core domain-containing protein, partial [Rhizomicrobium sp.]|nr:RHS repeat-associated core domain-containing protein [Rhizomicrobium sp.]